MTITADRKFDNDSDVDDLLRSVFIVDEEREAAARERTLQHLEYVCSRPETSPRSHSRREVKIVALVVIALITAVIAAALVQSRTTQATVEVSAVNSQGTTASPVFSPPTTFPQYLPTGEIPPPDPNNLPAYSGPAGYHAAGLRAPGVPFGYIKDGDDVNSPTHHVSKLNVYDDQLNLIACAISGYGFVEASACSDPANTAFIEQTVANADASRTRLSKP